MLTLSANSKNAFGPLQNRYFEFYAAAQSLELDFAGGQRLLIICFESSPFLSKVKL